jgi:flagellar biosynthesis protein FlhB
MSDVDKSSKTEPPTAKKLSESQSKGQFAKAPEIGMTLTLLAGLVVILFYAPGKAIEVMGFTKSIIQNLSRRNSGVIARLIYFFRSYGLSNVNVNFYCCFCC